MAIADRRKSAQAAKRKATELHAKIVRARGACESCGKTTNLQCAHLVSRRYSATRTDLNNAFCLCAGCHMRFTEWPLEFHRFVVNRIGERAYEILRLKAEAGGAPDWHDEVTRLSGVWAWKQAEA